MSGTAVAVEHLVDLNKQVWNLRDRLVDKRDSIIEQIGVYDEFSKCLEHIIRGLQEAAVCESGPVEKSPDRNTSNYTCEKCGQAFSDIRLYCDHLDEDFECNGNPVMPTERENSPRRIQKWIEGHHGPFIPAKHHRLVGCTADYARRICEKYVTDGMLKKVRMARKPGQNGRTVMGYAKNA